MRIIRVNPRNPSLKAIKIAAEVIKKGGVIIYPTDTIYGIGANALDKKAIEKVYQVKKRPEGKPLSVVIRDIKMAKEYCVIGKSQEEIFNVLLPGAFTLIFKKRSSRGVPRIFTGYKNTISVRIPDFKITSLLAKELKIPFAATSANISGLPGSGDIKKVLKQLCVKNKKPDLSRVLGIDLVLDAGVLPKKNPSIIIDLTSLKPKIIRK
jgi:L-threonylcarbamoyladenylate synthase